VTKLRDVIQFPAKATDFSSTKRASQQTNSRVHPASYPMNTREYFSSSKAFKARNWPLSSMCAEFKNEWSYTYRGTYTLMACTVTTLSLHKQKHGKVETRAEINEKVR